MKKSLFMLALAATLSINANANANHKTNVPTFDIAVIGGNFTGYTSIARCKSYNNGAPCGKLVSNCGPGMKDVYSTKFSIKQMVRAIKKGQKLPVHLMSRTGHFLKKMCTLSRAR